MFATDFEYDGQYLSDFGFIICQFDASNGTNIVSSGSTITFNTVSQHRGAYFGLAGTKYEECIQTTFDICKNPDIHKDMRITTEEYRNLARWLNRKEFLQLNFIDDVDYDTYYEPYYYDASFNIDKIKLHEVLYGMRLTMQTNRPFAYGKTITKILDATDESIYNKFYSTQNPNYKIEDKSDEIGYIYPKITITVTKDCNIRIYNYSTVDTMIINNCKKNEVITVDYPTITSEVPEEMEDFVHDLANDFNFGFIRIGNKYNNRTNRLGIWGYCTVKFEYNPIVKVGV